MNSNSLIGIISLILIVVLAQSVVIVKDTEKRSFETWRI